MKLTKIEIINETVEFYSKNPQLRSVDEKNKCSYNSGDGRHCAVGRCLLKGYQKQGVKLIGNICNLESFVDKHEKSLDSMLQARYRGNDESFWMSLQNLHDTHANWSDNGLTDMGQGEVNRLTQKFL